MNPVKSNKNTKETGIDLKAAREEKGLTLKEISQLTKISVSILDTIEKRDFSQLLEPVYSRAFIKTYAKVLNIDSEEILSSYNNYIAEIEPLEEKKEIAKKNVRPKSLYKRFAWATIVLALVLIAFFLYYSKHNETPEIAKAPPVEKLIEVPQSEPTGATSIETETKEIHTQAIGEPVNTQAVDEDKTVASEANISEPGIQITNNEPGTAQKAETATEDKKYTLDIKASELSWLKITEDDNPSYEILMKPGEKITREAREKFIIDIGNAGGVDIEFQGKPLGFLGEHGKVIHLVLPEKN